MRPRGTWHDAREVGALFAKLGLIGFGGPAAHIAMMRREVVDQRGWVDDQEFLDLVGATNLIPGPNSTELAIHLGARRAGWRGLIVAGVAFLVPAAVIVTLLAWAYTEYGRSAAFVDLSYGVLPVVLAIVVHAGYGLARTAVTSIALGACAVVATVLFVLGVNELLLLLAGGVFGAALCWWRTSRGAGGVAAFLALAWSQPNAFAALARARVETDPELWRVFLIFLKIGSVLYGSGYVLLAFLEQDLVRDLGWITKQQLLDAVAIGQVTPGPVFTTATFIGFELGGVAGAFVATVGIFLPSFVFVAFLVKIVQWARATTWVRPALDGINAAALGLLAGVTITLARTALPDPVTVLIGVAALAVLLRWNPNSAWLIAGGVVLGLIKLLA